MQKADCCGVWYLLATPQNIHQLWIKKSAITLDDKSIGKGLFPITTRDSEQVIFVNGEHIIDYVGETIAEHEREERYGDTGPYCIGERIVIQRMGLIHLWWIVLLQEVWLLLLTTNLSLKLMLGMCLMRTEMYTQLQQ